MVNINDTHNGTRLRGEFVRVAALVAQATGKIASAPRSYCESGVWRCFDAEGALLAEVSDSGSVVVATDEAPSESLIDRISDLRALGFDRDHITHWLTRRLPLQTDSLKEGLLVLRIAAEVIEAPHLF